jgi:hypothetical protein
LVGLALLVSNVSQGLCVPYFFYLTAFLKHALKEHCTSHSKRHERTHVADKFEDVRCVEIDRGYKQGYLMNSVNCFALEKFALSCGNPFYRKL